MQRAGQSAAAEISLRYSDRLRRGATVFTGPGNNGGDGWVVASALANAGIEVTVVEAVEARSPDAVAEKSEAVNKVRAVRSARESLDQLGPPGVVIDGLLGTGASGEPRDAIADCISRINAFHAQGSRVASLDIPSGLDASTGRHGQCVVADLTLTFGGIKRGSLIARDCCGEIVVLDIGLDEAAKVEPRTERSDGELPWLVDGAWVHAHIPPIPFDAHKGSRKHVAIIGGGPGMPGAVVLSARAAARSGAGLVRAFVFPDSATGVAGAIPFALVSAWPTEHGDISRLISKWAAAIVIGPGLGKSNETRELVEKVLRDSTLPVVLDADALNVFQGDTSALADLVRDRKALITPHVAEFSRLAGVDVHTVLDNRFDIGLDLARALGATVLLKGTPTVIFTPDGDRAVAARGTAALGTGGSGDVLSGIAGTMLAQTCDPLTAGSCAAWVHGRAAEYCEYVRGTTIEDVLYALPRAWNETPRAAAPPVLGTLPAVPK
jgi:ADP-dependent NAD(P)H-hydrate dehydratase / NAD(P)H-hydrate epimerase